MARKILKTFTIWFCLIVVPIVVFSHFYLEVPLDMSLFRLIILASFACLNFIYLVLLLHKVDMVIAAAFATTFWFAGMIYMRVRQDIDPHTQFIHIIAVLAVITIVVRLLLKKSLHVNLRKK